MEVQNQSPDVVDDHQSPDVVDDHQSRNHHQPAVDQNGWESLVEEGIREITGYKFRNPKLLHQAFTHHSFLDQDKTSKDSYERLEYIGDSVISIFSATKHVLTYPDLAAGELTQLRSANVDTEKLARVALHHRLYRFLRHKKPLLAAQIEQFEEAIEHHPVHSFGLVQAPKTLADIVESLVGAVYIDRGTADMPITFEVVEKLLQPMITPETLNTNPVTKLHQICQKHRVRIDTIDLWEECGVIEFIVNGEFAGRATYRGKREVANSRAALVAYKKVVAILNEKNAAAAAAAEKVSEE